MRIRSFHRTFLVVCAALATACNKDGDDTGFPWDIGCITVDEQTPGFANLRDAVTVADNGATIALCGTMEESVRIDKPLTLIGEGSDVTTWTAPDNEEEDRVDPALTVAAGVEVAIEGVSMRANYSTIIAEAGSTVNLTDVGIESTAAWGIDAAEATIRGSGIVIGGSLWGAIHLDGGILDLADSELANNVTYGVGLEGDATATIVRTSIHDTLPSDSSGANFDGWAIQAAEGAIVTLQDNTFDDNILGGVYAADQATVSFDGDVLDGNWTAVWAENSTIVMTDVSVLNSQQYDVLGQNSDLTLTNVDLKQDPVTSPHEDSTSTYRGGYGILAFDGSVDMDGGTISGHNGGGFLISGSVGSVMAVDLANVTVTDNTGMGGLVQLVDLTLTEVAIEATADDVALCESGSTYYCDWALAVFDANVTWTGGSLAGNDSMGIVVAGGSATLTDVDVADNGDNAIWGIDAAVSITGSTFTGGGAYGVSLQEGSQGILDGVTFVDRAHVDIADYTTVVYHWRYAGWDVAVYDSSLLVRDSEFTNGEQGIQVFGDSTNLSGTEVTIRDTTFTGYNENLVYAFDATVHVDGVDVTGIGARAVYCVGASIDVTDSTLAGGTAAKSGYTQFDDTGAVVVDSETTYVAPLIDGTDCSLDLDDVLVDGAWGQAIELDDSPFDATGLTVRGANAAVTTTVQSPAIDLDYGSTAPAVFIEDLTLTGVGAFAGLEITGGATSAGTSVELRGVRVGVQSGTHSGTADVGIRLDTVIGGLIDDFEVTGTGGAGIDIVDSEVTITGASPGASLTGTVSGTGGDGIHVASSDSVVTGVIITDTAGAGLVLDGQDHTVTDVQVSDAGAAGILLDDTSDVTLTGFDVTGTVGPGVDVLGGDVVIVGASGSRTGTISGAGGDGLRIDGGAVTVDDVTVVDATGDGASFIRGTPTVTGLTVTSADAYGVQCATDPVEDAPVFGSCTVTVVLATLGADDGCGCTLVE